MAIACLGPLLTFLWQCVTAPFRRDASWSDTIRAALHTFFLGCCFVVLVQQCSLATEMYQSAKQAHLDARRIYLEEDCARYSGASRARLAECSEMAVLINTWPLVRALTRLTQSWHSCLFMSCGDLIVAVSQQLQYKIVLVLLALALTSYVARLFQCTKKKSQKLVSAKRLAATLDHLRKQEEMDYDSKMIEVK